MNELSPPRGRQLAQPEHIQLQPRAPYNSEPEVSLSEYWNIIVRRRGIILLLLLVVFLAVAYFALSATTLYTATATVKIEPTNPRVTGMGELQPVESRGEYDYHQTQFALLRSRALAARVIDELNLEKNKSFTDSQVISPNPVDHIKSWFSRVMRYFSYYLAPLFRPEPAGDPSQAIPSGAGSDKVPLELTVKQYLIDRYLGFLYVEPVTDTRLVRINVTTPDPALSQALANAHVQHFVLMNFEGRFSLTNEARGFLDQKKTELQGKLEKSEMALNSFRRQHGVVSVEKGENIVVDRLVDLNRQLTTARAQRIEAESLYRTIENRSHQDLGEIMRQGLVQQLKSNMAALEAEKARLATVFKPEHPRILELNKQLAAGREAFDLEVASVIRGIKSNYAAALAKERGLESEAAKQQQEALKLKELGVNFTVLQEEVNANRSLYESVLKRLTETNVSNDLAISNMQIIERAAKPAGASGPNVAGYLSAGLISGLLIGLGAAFLLEFFDSMVHTPEDVRRAVGLSTLGVVPHLKLLTRGDVVNDQLNLGGLQTNASNGNGALAGSKSLIGSHNPLPMINESYRAIRTALLLSQAENPPQVILLTSPSPGEGKTLTSVNLAISLAHDGYSVLVIDGDMRKGKCHHRLGLHSSRGLSNVLTGSLSLAEGIQQTPVSGLSLLSRGIPPPNPSELLGSRRMREIITEVRERFDFILIDSPPAIGISDAAIVSVLTDGVVFVFNGETTSIPYAQKVVERLDTVRARLLGVVLNGVDLNHPDFSYYRDYSSYYGHSLSHREDASVEFSKGCDITVPTADMAEKSAPLGRRTASAANGQMTPFHNPKTVENGRASRSQNAAGVKNTTETENAGEFARGENRLQLKTGQAASPEESSELAAVSADALKQLTEALTKAIGPVAPQIVREQIAVLGESRYAFPDTRMGELLTLIEREITHDELLNFRRAISEELRQFANS